MSGLELIPPPPRKLVFIQAEDINSWGLFEHIHGQLLPLRAPRHIGVMTMINNDGFKIDVIFMHAIVDNIQKDLCIHKPSYIQSNNFIIPPGFYPVLEIRSYAHDVRAQLEPNASFYCEMLQQLEMLQQNFSGAYQFVPQSVMPMQMSEQVVLQQIYTTAEQEQELHQELSQKSGIVEIFANPESAQYIISQFDSNEQTTKAINLDEYRGILINCLSPSVNDKNYYEFFQILMSVIHILNEQNTDFNVEYMISICNDLKIDMDFCVKCLLLKHQFHDRVEDINFIDAVLLKTILQSQGLITCESDDWEIIIRKINTTSCPTHEKDQMRNKFKLNSVEEEEPMPLQALRDEEIAKQIKRFEFEVLAEITYFTDPDIFMGKINDVLDKVTEPQHILIFFAEKMNMVVCLACLMNDPNQVVSFAPSIYAVLFKWFIDNKRESRSIIDSIQDIILWQSMQAKIRYAELSLQTILKAICDAQIVKIKQDTTVNKEDGALQIVEPRKQLVLPSRIKRKTQKLDLNRTNEAILASLPTPEEEKEPLRIFVEICVEISRIDESTDIAQLLRRINGCSEPVLKMKNKMRQDLLMHVLKNPLACASTELVDKLLRTSEVFYDKGEDTILHFWAKNSVDFELFKKLYDQYVKMYWKYAPKLLSSGQTIAELGQLISNNKKETFFDVLMNDPSEDKFNLLSQIIVYLKNQGMRHKIHAGILSALLSKKPHNLYNRVENLWLKTFDDQNQQALHNACDKFLTMLVDEYILQINSVKAKPHTPGIIAQYWGLPEKNNTYMYDFFDYFAEDNNDNNLHQIILPVIQLQKNPGDVDLAPINVSAKQKIDIICELRRKILQKSQANDILGGEPIFALLIGTISGADFGHEMVGWTLAAYDAEYHVRQVIVQELLICFDTGLFSKETTSNEFDILRNNLEVFFTSLLSGLDAEVKRCFYEQYIKEVLTSHLLGQRGVSLRHKLWSVAAAISKQHGFADGFEQKDELGNNLIHRLFLHLDKCMSEYEKQLAGMMDLPSDQKAQLYGEFFYYIHNSFFMLVLVDARKDTYSELQELLFAKNNAGKTPYDLVSAANKKLNGKINYEIYYNPMRGGDPKLRKGERLEDINFEKMFVYLKDLIEGKCKEEKKSSKMRLKLG